MKKELKVFIVGFIAYCLLLSCSLLFAASQTSQGSENSNRIGISAPSTMPAQQKSNKEDKPESDFDMFFEEQVFEKQENKLETVKPVEEQFITKTIQPVVLPKNTHQEIMKREDQEIISSQHLQDVLMKGEMTEKSLQYHYAKTQHALPQKMNDQELKVAQERLQIGSLPKYIFDLVAYNKKLYGRGIPMNITDVRVISQRDLDNKKFPDELVKTRVAQLLYGLDFGNSETKNACRMVLEPMFNSRHHNWRVVKGLHAVMLDEDATPELRARAVKFLVDHFSFAIDKYTPVGKEIAQDINIVLEDREIRDNLMVYRRKGLNTEFLNELLVVGVPLPNYKETGTMYKDWEIGHEVRP